MKRIVLIIISIFALFVSYGITQTEDTDSTVMAFCELAKHLIPDIQFDPSAIKAYLKSAEKENAMGEDLMNIIILQSVHLQKTMWNKMIEVADASIISGKHSKVFPDIYTTTFHLRRQIPSA